MGKIDRLTYYINRAVPYCWDDSESWVEFLGKVAQKVNELVDLSNEYFEIDITEYATNILTEWRDSGELLDIVSNAFDAKFDTFNNAFIGMSNEIDGFQAVVDGFKDWDVQLSQKAEQASLEIEKQRIDNLMSFPEGSTTADAQLLDIKVGADGITYETAGEAVRANDQKQMERIDKYFNRTINRFNKRDEDILRGYMEFNGSIIPMNDLQTSHMISVEEGDVVRFSNVRMYGLYDADYNFVAEEYESLNTYPANYTITIPNGIKFLRATYRTSDIDGYMITINNPMPAIYVPYEVLQPDLVAYDDVKNPTFSKNTASSLYNESLSLETNAVMKNKTLSVSAMVTNLSTIRIGHGETVYGASYIDISGTDIKAYYHTSEPTLITTLQHSLNINNYINVSITVDKNRKATIRIVTDGGSYISEKIIWDGNNGSPFIKSIGSTLTDVEITWDTADYRKPIFAFGDSYLSNANSSRWPYHITNWGYDNWMLHGYPGQGSSSALNMLKFILSKAKPEILIWALGMNDGDSPSANSAWLADFTELKKICSVNNIELVACTIPSVPSVDNNFKNGIVKSSGLRYIDFDKAVGADVNVGWYAGMLSSDTVHPTELGAIALAQRAMLDVPELARN